MAAICSVCGEAFVRLVNDFYSRLIELGPIKVRTWEMTYHRKFLREQN